MILDMFKLEGKTAWVTGGTKGLGLMMANALAEAGAQIAINSRHGEAAETEARKIEKNHGRKCLGLGVDVTRPEEVKGAAERIVSELGGLDILVNNAGVNVRLPTVDLPYEEWKNTIDINLTGPFLCTQAAAPHMIKKKWGRIIHISSILGLVGLAGRPPYTASKGGLILLTKTQALEFATQGITVNAICPGPFATDMNKALLDDPEKYKAFVAKIPMGRWGELHELNGAILFLASDASSYVTGSTLTVDGGWTAW